MAQLDSAVPLLPARDVGASAEWFERELGFTTVFLYADYAGLRRDGAELHLFHMADVDPKTTSAMCYLRVTGIDELYAQCVARNIVHPNGPLTTKGWGQREFAVLDPNGTLLTFGAPA